MGIKYGGAGLRHRVGPTKSGAGFRKWVVRKTGGESKSDRPGLGQWMVFESDVVGIDVTKLAAADAARIGCGRVL